MTHKLKEGWQPFGSPEPPRVSWRVFYL
ncbi:DUF1737 domain-containing protein [Escherichia coli]